MSVAVDWVDARTRMLKLTFMPGWAWDDLYAALNQTDSLIAAAPHTVHVLIDIREAGRLPGDFMTVAGDLFAQGDPRPNEGYKIVLGAGRLMRVAYGAFLRVYGGRMEGRRPLQFVDDLDAAHQLIAQLP